MKSRVRGRPLKDRRLTMDFTVGAALFNWASPIRGCEVVYPPCPGSGVFLDPLPGHGGFTTFRRWYESHGLVVGSFWTHYQPMGFLPPPKTGFYRVFGSKNGFYPRGRVPFRVTIEKSGRNSAALFSIFSISS